MFLSDWSKDVHLFSKAADFDNSDGCNSNHKLILMHTVTIVTSYYMQGFV